MQPTRATSLRLILGWTLAILAAAAMWMSWGALYETARAVGGMPHERAVVFPVIIDVATIAAMLIVLLGKARAWVAWITLIVFGGLTVAGNAAHVVTVNPSHLAMGVDAGILVNSIPGVALLMVTHLAAVTVFGASRPDTEPATIPSPAVEAVPSRPAAARPEPAASTPRTGGTGRSKWSDEHRQKVAALAAENLTIPQIAERTGVPHSTVGRWLNPTTA